MPEENNNSNPPAEEAAETKAEVETPTVEIPAVETPPAESENKTPAKEAPVEETANEPAPEVEITGESTLTEPAPTAPLPKSAPAPEPPPPQSAAASTTSLPAQPANLQNLLAKAKAKIAERRQKNLDKILEALQAKGKLSNLQLRKLTKKSNATVFRYMNILEKQGQARQVGRTGKYTYYELIK